MCEVNLQYDVQHRIFGLFLQICASIALGVVIDCPRAQRVYVPAGPSQLHGHAPNDEQLRAKQLWWD